MPSSPRKSRRLPATGLICVLVGAAQGTATMANYAEDSARRLFYVVIVGLLGGIVAYVMEPTVSANLDKKSLQSL
jgi:hypothetical protein